MRKTSGPKPNIKLDNKVMKLRDNGLTFRQIAKLIDRDVHNAYFRYKRMKKIQLSGKENPE